MHIDCDKFHGREVYRKKVIREFAGYKWNARKLFWDVFFYFLEKLMWKTYLLRDQNFLTINMYGFEALWGHFQNFDMCPSFFIIKGADWCPGGPAAAWCPGRRYLKKLNLQNLRGATFTDDIISLMAHPIAAVETRGAKLLLPKAFYMDITAFLQLQ